MKAKLLAFTLCLVVMFPLNGVFHSLVAGHFFNESLAHLAPAMRSMDQIDPLPLLFLELTLILVMTYTISRSQLPIAISTGAMGGALINLTSAGAWNFANSAMMDWPLKVTIVDMAWHVALGAVGGSIIAWALNKWSK